MNLELKNSLKSIFVYYHMGMNFENADFEYCAPARVSVCTCTVRAPRRGLRLAAEPRDLRKTCQIKSDVSRIPFIPSQPPSAT